MKDAYIVHEVAPNKEGWTHQVIALREGKLLEKSQHKSRDETDQACKTWEERGFERMSKKEEMER